MADTSDTQVLDLSAQYRLLVDQTERGTALRLVSPNGTTPLVLEITDQGVVLRVDSPSIALHSSGDLSLSAEHLSLRGRSGLTLASGGDLQVEAEGDLTTRAQSQVVRAELGSVEIKASDDVKLVGERVLVNCDETVDEYHRTHS